MDGLLPQILGRHKANRNAEEEIPSEHSTTTRTGGATESIPLTGETAAEADTLSVDTENVEAEADQHIEPFLLQVTPTGSINAIIHSSSRLSNTETNSEKQEETGGRQTEVISTKSKKRHRSNIVQQLKNSDGWTESNEDVDATQVRTKRTRYSLTSDRNEHKIDISKNKIEKNDSTDGESLFISEISKEKPEQEDEPDTELASEPKLEEAETQMDINTASSDAKANKPYIIEQVLKGNWSDLQSQPSHSDETEAESSSSSSSSQVIGKESQNEHVESQDQQHSEPTVDESDSEDFEILEVRQLTSQEIKQRQKMKPRMLASISDTPSFLQNYSIKPLKTLDDDRSAADINQNKLETKEMSTVKTISGNTGKGKGKVTTKKSPVKRGRGRPAKPTVASETDDDEEEEEESEDEEKEHPIEEEVDSDPESEEDESEDEDDVNMEPDYRPGYQPKPSNGVKRGRGRPRIHPIPEKHEASAKRGRRRPKKIPLPPPSPPPESESGEGLAQETNSEIITEPTQDNESHDMAVDPILEYIDQDALNSHGDHTPITPDQDTQSDNQDQDQNEDQDMDLATAALRALSPIDTDLNEEGLTFEVSQETGGKIASVQNGMKENREADSVMLITEKTDVTSEIVVAYGLEERIVDSSVDDATATGTALDTVTVGAPIDEEEEQEEEEQEEREDGYAENKEGRVQTDVEQFTQDGKDTNGGDVSPVEDLKNNSGKQPETTSNEPHQVQEPETQMETKTEPEKETKPTPTTTEKESPVKSKKEPLIHQPPSRPIRTSTRINKTSITAVTTVTASDTTIDFDDELQVLEITEKPNFPQKTIKESKKGKSKGKKISSMLRGLINSEGWNDNYGK